MTKEKHTPLPWKLDTAMDEQGNGDFVIHNGVTICKGDDEAIGWEENAAFIVRACNSHHELVHCLGALLERHIDFPNRPPFEVDWSIRAREALKKAKGEGGEA